jgi:uncharacterized lipoprotein YddW (UPF0748 family)
MKNKSLITVLVLLFFYLTNALGQEIPKREMRAAWVTTVWGLDWPAVQINTTGSTYYIQEQKDQFIGLLNQLQAANMNTVFFQVRSECDAMYQSSYEPWSVYLVAERGMDPGYDPLQFIVEECHKRGMEIHAWLNPYRFESVAGKYEGEAGDYRQTHPEWVLEYPDGGSAILDPGNPGVRERIADIVGEIITNYDVDGIVFDDYFYAYGGTPSSLDAYSQSLYKPSDMNLDDWRRWNVNQMVKEVYERINSIKPWITFGLSPFGIWTTDPNVAEAEGLELPSGITGMNAYSSIYCDPVAWLKEGTVDYISPQLYWPTTSTGQDYDVLAPWWSNVCNLFGKHLYVSHSLSDLTDSNYAPVFDDGNLKSGGTDSLTVDLKGLSMLEYYSQMDEYMLKASLDASEFGKQVQVNRTADKNGAPGSVFFRAAMFYKTGFVNYLSDYEFANLSLPPAVNWKPHQERGIPHNLAVNSNTLSWESDETNVRYAVYAVPNSMLGEAGVFSSSDYLIGVSYDKTFDITDFSDLTGTHSFAVSVLDRFGNEFPPAVMGYTPGANQTATLSFPGNGVDVFNPFSFQWDAVSGADSYVIEVAQDDLFANVVYSRQVDGTEFSAENIAMNTGQTYYWRIRTRMAGVEDAVSPVSAFNLIPQPSSEILSPLNNATGLSMTPVIEWTDFGEGFTYNLQISRNDDFSSFVFSENQINGLSLQVPENTLTAWSDYYVRVRAENGETVSAWSPVVTFSTIEQVPGIPEIISPAEGSSVEVDNVLIQIADEPYANGFTVQVSSQSSFPWTDRSVYVMDAFQTELLIDNIGEGPRFIRVKAEYSNSSSTDWSESVSFNVVPTSISDINTEDLQLICENPMVSDKVALNLELPESGNVSISLSDITGRVVKVVKNEFLNQGEHTIFMNTSDLMPGLYFLSVQTENSGKTLKLMK